MSLEQAKTETEIIICVIIKLMRSTRLKYNIVFEYIHSQDLAIYKKDITN